METFVMVSDRVVCSTAEARKWQQAGSMTGLPAFGDTVVRFPSNTVPEIGKVGISAVISQIEAVHTTHPVARSMV